MMKKNLRKKGQAMVEWAIILPVLLVLVFGTMQWGMIELSQHLTHYAAHKAARAELVNESGFDAASICLLPVAGWTDHLEGYVGSTRYVLDSSSHSQVSMPGWSPFRRSHVLVDRVAVTVLENDWDKVSVEVVFNCELLFPFVDLFFANINERYVSITGEPGATGQIGMARTTDSTVAINFVAGNYIELKAKNTVMRIDRPRDSNILLGDSDGIQQPQGKTLFTESPFTFQVSP